jgi:uncharacterized protein YggE
MSEPLERWISVSASGEASVAPDLAIVRFAVTETGKELDAARETVNIRSSAVLAGVRDLGVADADLRAPDVQIHPEYDYRHGQKLIGYRVVRQMTVRVKDLDKLGDLLDGIVAAGANEVHGAEMTASDPSAADRGALASAVAIARARAHAIAEAAGVTLGEVVRVEEGEPAGGGLPPMGMMAMEKSGDVPTEVASGDLTVTRHVRAWFSIS